MQHSFNEEAYTTECNSCGRDNSFKATRVVHEVEQLDLSDSGYVHVDDHDLHDQDSWEYECNNCGNTGRDLEDILAEREDEEEDEY